MVSFDSLVWDYLQNFHNLFITVENIENIQNNAKQRKIIPEIQQNFLRRHIL